MTITYIEIMATVSVKVENGVLPGTNLNCSAGYPIIEVQALLKFAHGDRLIGPMTTGVWDEKLLEYDMVGMRADMLKYKEDCD